MTERVLYGKDDDLTYNRIGRLSPRQAELSARPLRWAAVAVALGAIVSLLIGLLAPLLLGLDRSTRMVFAGGLGLAALGELIAAWFILRSAQRQAERPIEVVEGRIERLPANRGALPVRIALGDRMITVPRPDLPLRIGGRYRAYGLMVTRQNVLMTYTLVELVDEEAS